VTSSEFHLSPAGSDTGSGALHDPFRTLEHALGIARSRSHAHVTLRLLSGHHRLERPVAITSADSGLRIRGEAGAVVSGAATIDTWEETRIRDVRCWQAHIPNALEIRSLFVNGERRARPRYPREGTLRFRDQPGLDLNKPALEWVEEGSDTFGFDDGDIPVDLHDHPAVEAVSPHFWLTERMPLTEIDHSRNVVVSSHTSALALRDSFADHWAPYYLDNVRESLGEVPGEWYFDRESRVLTYVPLADERTDSVAVEAPLLTELLVVGGSADAPVTDIEIEGITFESTDWRIWPTGRPPFDLEQYYPADIAYASAGQAEYNAAGSISLSHARDISLHDCTIQKTGGYGLALGDDTQCIEVSRNRLTNLGAGGVKISGRETGVTCTGHRLESNTVAYAGEVSEAGVGVLLLRCWDVQVRGNHIHDLGYSGISAGWVWGYDHPVAGGILIEGNYIHQIGNGQLSDMGAIYTLGVQPGTTIRGNLVHGVRAGRYGGFGIYLDEGSSHIVIEENTVFDVDGENLHVHYGRENTARRNVFVNGGHGLVSITRPEEHVPLVLERNVLVALGQQTSVFTGFTPRPGSHRGRVQDPRLISDLNAIQPAGAVAANFSLNEEMSPVMGESFSAFEWAALGNDRHSWLGEVPLDSTSGTPRPQWDSAALRELGFAPVDVVDVGATGAPKGT
jgi:hypothetical protein